MHNNFISEEKSFSNVSLKRQRSIEIRAFERMSDQLLEEMVAVQRKQDPDGEPLELSEFSDHSLAQIVRAIMGTNEDVFVHNALIKHLVNNRYDILQDAKNSRVRYEGESYEGY